MKNKRTWRVSQILDKRKQIYILLCYYNLQYPKNIT